MNKKKEETKRLVLTRVPPYDHWKSNDGVVLESLTDGLEHVFQQTKISKFYISTLEGQVYAVTEEEIDIPVKKYSIYGDRI